MIIMSDFEIYNKKNEIRKKLLKLRVQLSQQEINKNSIEIFKKVYDLDIYKTAEKVMCYASFRNEVITFEFIKNCLLKNKRIILPKVVYKNGERKLELYEISDAETEIAVGAYGIPEPSSSKVFDGNKLDLILVPGVAFDSKKNRLGYGMGYYDRFLGMIQGNIPKIGLAYEMQLVNDLPSNEYDIKMDLIITEKRIVI